MKKNEFIDKLNYRLRNHPEKTDIISYYYELIQDKIDAGENEDEVIASLGDIDEIIKKVESDYEELDLEDVKFKNIDESYKEEAAKAKKDHFVYGADKHEADAEKHEEKPKTVVGKDKRASGNKIVLVLIIIAIVLLSISGIKDIVSIVQGLTLIKLEAGAALITIGGSVFSLGFNLLIISILGTIYLKMNKKNQGI